MNRFATAKSLNSPTDGDTKPCPQCHQTLVYSGHYPILTVGISADRTGPDSRDRIGYQRGWVCRNGGCNYRELLGEA